MGAFDNILMECLPFQKKFNISSVVLDFFGTIIAHTFYVIAFTKKGLFVMFGGFNKFY